MGRDRLDDDYTPDAETVVTSEELFKGIGSEFGTALSPFMKRLDAIEQRMAQLESGQAGLTKALGGEPGMPARSAAPVTASQYPGLQKGINTPHAPAGARFTPTEAEEANMLIEKGMQILSEHRVALDGLEQAVDARNAGTITREDVAKLRKSMSEQQFIDDMQLVQKAICPAA